ncbi:MAG: hypothetical protein ACKESB_00120, partial [Candidatus Hodgkinia cicadicola]
GISSGLQDRYGKSDWGSRGLCAKAKVGSGGLIRYAGGLKRLSRTSSADVSLRSLAFNSCWVCP